MATEARIGKRLACQVWKNSRLVTREVCSRRQRDMTRGVLSHSAAMRTTCNRCGGKNVLGRSLSAVPATPERRERCAATQATYPSHSQCDYDCSRQSCLLSLVADRTQQFVDRAFSRAPLAQPPRCLHGEIHSQRLENSLGPAVLTVFCDGDAVRRIPH
jgi:hypothetical protein